MRMLAAPFQYVKRQRARRKQVRMALQMLSVSGVVRPGHVEPRYFEQAARIHALYRQADRPTAVAPVQPSPASRWQREIKLDLSRIRHWIGALKPARLQVNQ